MHQNTFGKEILIFPIHTKIIDVKTAFHFFYLQNAKDLLFILLWVIEEHVVARLELPDLFEFTLPGIIERMDGCDLKRQPIGKIDLQNFFGTVDEKLADGHRDQNLFFQIP